MVSQNTLQTVKHLLEPAASAGVIPPNELKELLALGKGEPKTNGQAKPQRELLTLQEVAAILKVHVKTVHDYIKAGRLEKIKLGRHASRIPTSSLDAFLAESKALPCSTGETPSFTAGR